MTDKAARSSFWTDVTRLPLGTTCTMEQVMRRGMSSTERRARSDNCQLLSYHLGRSDTAGFNGLAHLVALPS